MEKLNHTTYEISKFCGISIQTVIDWIDQGKLPAYRTIGGHRRVQKESLVSFLEVNNIPIPADLQKKHSTRILIVEDDELISRVITKTIKLMKGKYETAVATDGFEAGKQILAFKPDLVILDLKLPGVDGFKVCRDIRADKLTMHIKILTITGYDSEENKKKILECGANSYLPKPFEVKDLTKYIKELLYCDKDN